MARARSLLLLEAFSTAQNYDEGADPALYLAAARCLVEARRGDKQAASCLERDRTIFASPEDVKSGS
ncbi:hypothetical protein T484DRAFT_1826604 [Baffinella frigidus]|nr:hypothetical protein T484DRAFT_1826604 [Cryptophyta sp. CCMP2293]